GEVADDDAHVLSAGELTEILAGGDLDPRLDPLAVRLANNIDGEGEPDKRSYWQIEVRRYDEVVAFKSGDGPTMKIARRGPAGIKICNTSPAPKPNERGPDGKIQVNGAPYDPNHDTIPWRRCVGLPPGSSTLDGEITAVGGNWSGVALIHWK
ncbi:MAG: hypothetical protein ABL996_26485, partial [Micropepsaceae bacterium]